VSNSAHLDACTRPDCGDLRTVVGQFPTTSGAVFEKEQVHWIVVADRTIYRCNFPDCVDGPRAFGIGGAGMQMLTATADWLYWLDTGQVMRKRKDGSSPSERLELGAALGTVADGGVGFPSVTAIQADGSWLYALASGDRTDAGTTCKLAVGPCVIARWPENVGGAREIIVTSDTGIEFMKNGIRVLQGEVAFTTDQTYTCTADACAATMRPIGRADPGRMASDRDYLYWCTDEQSPLFASLQRVARLRR
jgi:hypothetical protein